MFSWLFGDSTKQRFIQPDVVRIQGARPGKTLVITGGVDGDEYAGIAAARQIIETFRDKNFAGQLVVVPLVNVSGNESRCSQNPIDGKFPKNIFPGRARGTSSEQLMHWFATEVLPGADLWLDLHGGATDEHLNPFLWTYETSKPEINNLVKEIHQVSQAERIVYQRAPLFSKAELLAKLGCAYVMAESGELGQVKAEDVERHIAWVEVAMNVLEMHQHSLNTKKISSKIFREISFVSKLSEESRSSLLWWKDANPDNLFYALGLEIQER